MYSLAMRAPSRQRNILFSMRHYGGFLYTTLQQSCQIIARFSRGRLRHHLYVYVFLFFLFTSFKYNTMYNRCDLRLVLFPIYFRGFTYFIYSLYLEKCEIKDVCLQRRQQTRAGTETKSQAKKTWGLSDRECVGIMGRRTRGRTGRSR